jgi:hypothetical protein
MAWPESKIDPVELEKLYGMQCTDEETAAWVQRFAPPNTERRRKSPGWRAGPRS